MATRKTSFPFVIISEFSRKAAHELDNIRLEYLKLKKEDKFWDLPVGEEYQPEIPENVNHYDLLSDEDHLYQNYATAQSDVRKLQSYLAVIKVTKNIGGKVVTREELNAHRDSVVNNLRYRENLSSQIKTQVYNLKASTRSQFTKANQELKNTAMLEAGFETAMINHLLRIAKTYAKRQGYVFLPEHVPYIEQAQAHVDGKLSEYIEKHGADNLMRQMTSTHNPSEEFSKSISATDEWSEKMEKLSAKDKSAIRHIIDQLLLKKQMSN